MAQSAFMKKLRDSMKAIFIIVIVVFVASIVFQRGMGGSQNRNEKNINALAIVGDDIIEPIDYSRALDNALSRARDNNPNITEGMVSQIREQTWQEIVNNTLFRKQLEKMDIKVSETELNEEVRRNPPDFLKEQPSFQTEGRFDFQKFIAYVNDPSADQRFVAAVETSVRDQISDKKLKQYVNNMSIVTRHAALEELIRNTTEVRAEYLRFSSEPYRDSIAAPSEEQLKKYFEANKSDYDDKSGVMLGHAFVKLEVIPRDSAQAKNRIDSVYARLQDGEDFNILASQFSQDPSVSENQGNLGWITEGRLVPEFENTIFDMDSGEVSEPFLTDYGWHIARVEGINDTLEAVNASHILIRIEPTFETLDSVAALADEIQAKAMVEGLETAAKDLEAEYDETGLIDKNDPIPGLGFHTLVNNFAQTDSINAIFEIVASPDGYHIFQIMNKIKEGQPEFADIYDIVKNDYISDRAKAMAKQKAQQAREEIMKSDGFTAAGFNADTLNGSALAFNPENGLDPIFAGTLLGIKEDTVSPVIEGIHGSYYVIRVKERTSPTSEDIQNLIDQYHSQLVSQNEQQAFDRWFINLRENTNIEDRRLVIGR